MSPVVIGCVPLVSQAQIAPASSDELKLHADTMHHKTSVYGKCSNTESPIWHIRVEGLFCGMASH